MNLIAIDIGGTTIKIATWINKKIKMVFTIDTPDNLDTFYEELTDAVNEIKAKNKINGVAISSLGAVNKKTGVIEGASALPYIHNFKIVPELEKKFGLPVSIENDANCAALAELADTDDVVAQEERGKLIHALATAIYNIQHSFDPEKIIIDGGISQNSELVPLLSDAVDKIRNNLGIATIKPNLDICTLKNEANLRGAVADFEKEH